MRRKGKVTAERNAERLASLADAKGATLQDIRITLGEDSTFWPRVPLVRDPRVCPMFASVFPFCWVCGMAPAQVHHGAAGSRGKRDHMSLLFALCQEHHDIVNGPDLPLAKLLALKYSYDFPHTDFEYMTLCWRYFLPDFSEFLKAGLTVAGRSL